MKHLIFILFLSISTLITIPVMADGASSDTSSSLTSLLCNSGKCDLYKGLATSQLCIDSFDQYFEISGGEMPYCIPRFDELSPDAPYPTNELFCYANWRVTVQENCDPIFDPAIDQYGIINEDYGTSPYEICLMNHYAQLDTCSLAFKMQCISSCYTEVVRPCYTEYEITHDTVALDECITNVQPRLEKCDKKKTNCKSYLYPELDNN